LLWLLLLSAASYQLTTGGTLLPYISRHPFCPGPQTSLLLLLLLLLLAAPPLLHLL
jgi:hypothetical protein